MEHLRAALVDPQADVRQRYWVVSFRDTSGKSQEGFLMNEDSYTVQFMDMSERLALGDQVRTQGLQGGEDFKDAVF